MSLDPISSIADLANTIVSRIWPNADEANKQAYNLQIQELLLQSKLLNSQAQTNTNEARNPNVFVSGWRPAVGWVCALIFAWTYLIQPLLVFCIVASGHPIPPLPQLDMANTITVLMGMLGLGMMRSFDKKAGQKK